MANKDFRFGISGSLNGVDLNQLLVNHAPSTYFMRVATTVSELDVYEGDIIIVDRQVTVRKKDIIVVSEKGETQLKLVRADQQQSQTELWGVVTYIIRKVRA